MLEGNVCVHSSNPKDKNPQAVLTQCRLKSLSELQDLHKKLIESVLHCDSVWFGVPFGRTNTASDYSQCIVAWRCG